MKQLEAFAAGYRQLRRTEGKLPTFLKQLRSHAGRQFVMTARLVTQRPSFAQAQVAWATKRAGLGLPTMLPVEVVAQRRLAELAQPAPDTFTETIGARASPMVQVADENLAVDQKVAITELLANLGQPRSLSDPQFRNLEQSLMKWESPHHYLGLDPENDRGSKYHYYMPDGRGVFEVFGDDQGYLRAVRVFFEAGIELPGAVRMGMTMEEVDALYGFPKERVNIGAVSIPLVRRFDAVSRPPPEGKPDWRRYAITPDASSGNANHVRVFFNRDSFTEKYEVSSIQYELTSHRTVRPGASTQSYSTTEP